MWSLLPDSLLELIVDYVDDWSALRRLSLADRRTGAVVRERGRRLRRLCDLLQRRHPDDVMTSLLLHPWRLDMVAFRSCLAVVPRVEHVHFLSVCPISKFAPLLTCLATIPKLETLSLGQLPPDALGTLAATRAAGHFSELHRLQFCARMQDVVRHLASPLVAGLTVLNMGVLGDDGMARFASLPAAVFASLRCLRLRNNRLGPEGMAAFVRVADTFRALRTLDLDYNDVGDLGFKALAEAGVWPHLEYLSVAQNLLLGREPRRDEAFLR